MFPSLVARTCTSWPPCSFAGHGLSSCSAVCSENATQTRLCQVLVAAAASRRKHREASVERMSLQVVGSVASAGGELERHRAFCSQNSDGMLGESVLKVRLEKVVVLEGSPE